MTQLVENVIVEKQQEWPVPPQSMAPMQVMDASMPPNGLPPLLPPAPVSGVEPELLPPSS
jgi:hypothetical protein